MTTHNTPQRFPPDSCCTQLYAWETGPVADLAVFLLCGELVDYKVSRDHTCEKQGGVTVETL
jgi:hypothetical protein